MKTSLVVLAGVIALSGCGKKGLKGEYVGSGAHTSFSKVSFRDDTNVDIGGMETWAGKYTLTDSLVRVVLANDGTVFLFDVTDKGCLRLQGNGSEFCKKS